MAKTALITGITGQDGAYLAKFLLDKGYKVFGTYRRSSTPNFWRLQYIGVFDKITLIPADMADMASLMEAITVSQCDELYNLAAQSYVGASFDQPLHTADIDGMGTTRILEIIRHLKKDIKFYQASTSELYGANGNTPQSEKTEFMPNSPYAAAKLYSFHITRIYREAYNIFATNGILFNHESPLRSLEFVTRKVTNSVARIKLNLQKDLKLGNLDAKRDWGFAPEYVEAMWMMTQHKKPDDFVVATGETHTVREFCQLAFEAAGLNYEDFVKVDKMLIRPLDVPVLCGDHSKITQELGWRPKTKFKELVSIMVKEDLKRWEKYHSGEIFPWDSPNYPANMSVIKRSIIEGARY
ncbi:GDP-mannose 4,6-dehydratase [Candidatus Woesearchaeota archaeon]|nr:GDP-mannose 4,6-dehydratase [Candidatus Woesearchaeota archaeon]